MEKSAKVKIQLQKRLKEEKPLVYAKSKQYHMKIKNGEYALAMIELAYDYKCNLHCSHCYARNLEVRKRKLTIKDLKDLSRQADEAGVFQFNLQGGEPLILKDLDKIILALNPERFHITITTNATKLNFVKAKHLRSLGVDKISVSLDSINEKEYDAMRKSKGLYRKTIQALFNAQKAGLHVNINTVITRQNVRSEETIKIAKFAEKHDFTLLCIVAVPIGQWEGKYEVMIKKGDARYLRELSSRFPVIRRDIYPAYGIDYGCRTMNGLVYITPSGDLLSCPFIHISIGNILDEPLIDILRRGWRVKYFRNHTNKCLAGEDNDFVKNIIFKTFGQKTPVRFEDVFKEKDLYAE